LQRPKDPAAAERQAVPAAQSAKKKEYRMSQKFETLAEKTGASWSGVVVRKRAPKGPVIEHRQGGFPDSRSASRWAEAQLADIERQEASARARRRGGGAE
jgi:hypothetical protein